MFDIPPPIKALTMLTNTYTGWLSISPNRSTHSLITKAAIGAIINKPIITIKPYFISLVMVLWN